jgi:glutamine synthetase
MSASDVLKTIGEQSVKFIDLRFTDTRGKEQHLTIPAKGIDSDFFERGMMFDGSSIAGWKGINESDMVLMPDAVTAVLDPFTDEVTMNLTCDVLEPHTMQGYERDPRSVARRAEAYLQSTGIADTAFFGPEPEFFIFDDVRWGAGLSGCFVEVDSEEAHWRSAGGFENGNKGHRPRVKGGYFPVPPVDSLHNIRTAMVLAMEEMGLDVEVHHHEVATAGQCEIGVKFNTLVRKADEVQILKGDNGSGMHVHQSLSKGGVNLFAGDKYGGLSELALYYIGGIFKHARALNAITNPGTNSYKRLVPGYEAPVMLAYSARNRSASVRIPWVSSPKGRRIEVRFPDPTANPYLAFAALLMAGLDGIKNKIHPGEAMDKDLYDLPREEAKAIPQVCHSLDMALDALDADRGFLTAGGVFTDGMIDGYIDLKMEDVTRLRMTTHPVEYDMYYSS